MSAELHSNRIVQISYSTDSSVDVARRLDSLMRNPLREGKLTVSVRPDEFGTIVRFRGIEKDRDPGRAAFASPLPPFAEPATLTVAYEANDVLYRYLIGSRILWILIATTVMVAAIASIV